MQMWRAPRPQPEHLGHLEITQFAAAETGPLGHPSDKQNRRWFIAHRHRPCRLDPAADRHLSGFSSIAIAMWWLPCRRWRMTIVAAAAGPLVRAGTRADR